MSIVGIILVLLKRKSGYFLGGLSMCLYLIYFFLLLFKEDCECGLLIPSWSAQQHFISVSVVLAVIVFGFFEQRLNSKRPV